MNLVSLYATGALSPLSVSPMAEGDRGQGGSSTANTIDNILGKDAFLRLLTTQLRYQDPLKPIDDQDFIAQMAQFSALEQMQNLTQQFEQFINEERATNRMARATSLLGRKVEVQGANGIYTGTVEAVRMLEGVPHLVVDNVLFGVEDVIKVY